MPAPVRCRRAVGFPAGPYDNFGEYGGPGYETWGARAGSFASMTWRLSPRGVATPATDALDTLSTGVAIGFVMEPVI